MTAALAMFGSADLCSADRETVRIIQRAKAAGEDAEKARAKRLALEAARRR
ncbi:hypothetical protein [Streptomyces sp. NPDC057557]|uniref:hypothetical protein n=1 Tax=Streptomyces sp. NPDC057557 TaxID=3346167 RepID=UPI0036A69C41